MKKHIWRVGTVAAALAASTVLVSAVATAQSYGGQAGPSRGYEQNYRHPGGPGGPPQWRRPDFNTALRDCSRAGFHEAGRRGYYSAQYDKTPKLVETRRGYHLEGRMRVMDHRGFSNVSTVCDLRPNGSAADFSIRR